MALILVDATVGFTEQDSKIAGYAHEQGKACIIVVNKWDAVEGKETNTMELQRRGYAECFSFMSYAPIIFISAQTGYNIDRLMRLIREVDTQNGARVPTGVLNEMLARGHRPRPASHDKGRRLKIFYLTQGVHPSAHVRGLRQFQAFVPLQLPAGTSSTRSARASVWNTLPSVWWSASGGTGLGGRKGTCKPLQLPARRTAKLRRVQRTRQPKRSRAAVCFLQARAAGRSKNEAPQPWPQRAVEGQRR